MVDEVPEHNIIMKEFPNTNLPFVRLRNDSRRLYFRHWEVQMRFPTMVFILLVSGILVYLICIHPYFLSSKWKILCLLNILFSLAMFLWSYLAAVCMDPGFLPYDWFATQRTKYSWEEQLEGLATTSEQFEFAMSHPRPLGSCFSSRSGRFVLRPDHICGWIANWVGKRNHKQFILMMIYGSLFASSLAWPRLLIRLPNVQHSDPLEFLRELAIVIECIFTVGLLSGFASQIINLRYNSTKLDRLKKRKQTFKNPETTKFYTGFHEVCGNGSKCFWLLPTPAFDDSIPFDIEEPKKPEQKNTPLIQFETQNIPILDEDDYL